MLHVILTLVLLIASGLAAQTTDQTLPGKSLRPPRAEDVRAVSFSVAAALNIARQRGTLTPELAALAETALRDRPPNPPTAESERRDYTKAYRLLTEVLVRLRGGEWTKEMEFASSFDFQIPASIIAPGEPATYRIEPWFTTGWTPPSALTARVELRFFAGQVIATRDIAVKEFKLETGSFPTARLQPGRYLVCYDLLGAAGKPLASADREFQVSPDAKRRAAALKAKLPQLRRHQARGAGFAIAAETGEYIAASVALACGGFVADRWKQSHPFYYRLIRESPAVKVLSLDPFDLGRDLDLAEALVNDLIAKKDPFANRTGDMHLAYRSPVDGTLQPFRIFVPEGLDRSRKHPVILGLHGGGTDENSYMERFASPGAGKNLFKRLGQERGYILVAPKGRGPSSAYVGDAEQDVLDVLDLVEKLYPVSRNQVFLTGISMGGSGTWGIGFKHQQRFAALAPVACSYSQRWDEFQALPFETAAGKPVLFSYGLKDIRVPPEDTRKTAAIAKGALTNIRVEEYPDDDHTTIWVASMPRIFDFFDEQRRRGTGKEQ